MSLSEIITDSIKYPFSDITNFLIVGIIALLSALANIFTIWKITNALYFIGIVVSVIFSLIFMGYALGIIQRTLEYSDELPMLDPVNNFIDGIKVLVIGIVYLFIPVVISLVLAIITGAIGAGLNNVGASVVVAGIITIIVFIAFGIFEIIAIARFAKTKEFGDAFNFGEIIEDMKSIGIAKVIAFLIISIIIMLIAALIAGLFVIIPFVGILIADLLLGAFVALFFYRGIGLLYLEA